MAGIVSYGGYIPLLRLNRGVMFMSNAWLNPRSSTVAQGERSMCKWDGTGRHHGGRGLARLPAGA